MMSACSMAPAAGFLKEHHNDLIVQEDFGVCQGYGCRYYQKTGLEPEEWQQIVDVFVPVAENAAQERQLIKRAIGLLESFVGPKTGTDRDEAGAQVISFSTRGQMDCIDEAFNASTYLFLLRKAGLIRLHRLGKPLHRGNYITRWPHNAATIHQIDDFDAHYVVDSWFHANGEPPEIVPAALWLSGWSPDKK